MQIALPLELLNFLKSNQKLRFDHKLAITGKVTLVNIERLRIGHVYSAAISKSDPNFGREGVYRIPAISLIESCQYYSPEYLLCFLPLEGKFAALDSDHAKITVFKSATWLDISQDPVLYLNALWEKKPLVSVSRRVRWWETYCFYEDAQD